MKCRFRRPAWAVSTALALFGLASCILEGGKSAKRGSEVENEVYGILVALDGTPVQGAKVKAAPTVPGTPKRGAEAGAAGADSVQTDASGRYAFRGLPSGSYNLFGDYQAGSLVVLIPDVDRTDTSGKLDVGTDTLRAPGRIRGRLVRGQTGMPGVLAYVPGTSYLSVSDDSGRFVLSGVPQGRYLVRYTLAGYVAAPDTGVMVKSGAITDLPTRQLAIDTVPPPPAPEAAGAQADTLLGRARIQWRAVDVDDLGDYVIYRDDAFGQPAMLGNTRDTSFVDSAFSVEQAAATLVYRVKARDRMANQSLSFSPPASIQAFPADRIRTVFAWDSPERDTVESDDPRIAFAVSFANPTRSLRMERWIVGTDSALPVDPFPSFRRQGRDSVLYPTQYGTFMVTARFRETSGIPWSATRTVTIRPRPKLVDLGRDTLLRAGDTVRLHADPSPRLGAVAGWEWDIGGTGSYRKGTSGDTAFPFPAGVDSLVCGVRATNDSGEAAEDWKVIRLRDSSAGEWEEIPAVGAVFRPLETYGAAVFRDSLWVIGGQRLPGPDDRPDSRSSDEVWVSGDGRAWSRKEGVTGLPAAAASAVVAFRGHLWALGTRTEFGVGSEGSYRSADGVLWSKLPETILPLNRVNHNAVEYAGKLWIFGGENGYTYTQAWASEDGIAWSLVSDSLPFHPSRSNSAAVFANRIFIADIQGMIWSSQDGKSWSLAVIPVPSPAGRTGLRMMAVDGLLWIICGQGDWEGAPVEVWKLSETGQKVHYSNMNGFRGLYGLSPVQGDRTWILATRFGNVHAGLGPLTPHAVTILRHR